jgi:hypothetical protein
MSLTELIDFFEGKTKVPILIADVQAFVMDRVNVARLQFIDVDLDTRDSRGFLHSYQARRSPYSELEICCDIHLPTSLPSVERRVVACKEIIHLLDPQFMRMSDEQQVSHLISRVTSRRRPQPTVQDRLQDVRVRWDFLNEHVPGAVLFPMAIRSVWIEQYKRGDLTSREIADTLQVPESLALFVLDDQWPELYQQIRELFA